MSKGKRILRDIDKLIKILRRLGVIGKETHKLKPYGKPGSYVSMETGGVMNVKGEEAGNGKQQNLS
jgi:hypothetical protein